MRKGYHPVKLYYPRVVPPSAQVLPKAYTLKKEKVKKTSQKGEERTFKDGKNKKNFPKHPKVEMNRPQKKKGGSIQLATPVYFFKL